MLRERDLAVQTKTKLNPQFRGRSAGTIARKPDSQRDTQNDIVVRTDTRAPLARPASLVRRSKSRNSSRNVSMAKS